MIYCFSEHKNTMVITTKDIVNGKKDILLVSHDEEDGIWEFLDGDTAVEEDATIISLFEIVQLDESVNVLYDLPLGWLAYRQNKNLCWKRYPI